MTLVVDCHKQLICVIVIRTDPLRCVYPLSLICGRLTPCCPAQAKGFNVDYLAKVPEVKDTVHKHSLLHHLCHMVMEKYPESSDLYSEVSGAILYVLGSVRRC